MKKLTAILLVVMMIFVCSFASACGKVPNPSPEPIEENHKPVYDSTNDYFRFVMDENGKSTGKRLESERNYDDVFVYTFTEDDEKALNDQYELVLDLIKKAERYDESKHKFVKDSDYYKANKTFEEDYNIFYDMLENVIEQYQYAYVFYCVDEKDEKIKADYEYISEIRTDVITKFYSLYRPIYETQFREYFFSEEDGWTEEDIKEALIASDSYGTEKYKKLQDRATEIEVEFREIFDPSEDSKVLELYAEYVKINNQIAALAGYDNYCDYAYANSYDREYTPDEVSEMTDLVKENFRSVFLYWYNKYFETYQTTFDKKSPLGKYYNAISTDSVIDSELGTKLIADYFDLMYSETAGKKTVDFYTACNDLFKNGNYFTGKYEGAFSYWISSQDTSILFFGPKSYSSAFTFVHEFGHYYNGIYNNGASMSYDLEETHSQGDEMLFLSYLKGVFPASVTAAYNTILNDQMFNAAAIIMLASAVDEFEQCVYTNSYSGNNDREGKLADGITPDEYDYLFNVVMSEFGVDGRLNDSYWRYVVIEAPCYYISYAMSMLPCMELYVIAEEEGLEVAMEKYFKLFTFTDDEKYSHIDNVGDLVVDASYRETLNYAGLASPFEKELYDRLAAKFK